MHAWIKTVLKKLQSLPHFQVMLPNAAEAKGSVAYLGFAVSSWREQGMPSMSYGLRIN